MRRLCLVLAFVVLSAPVSATDLRDVITDVTITSWNEKDGLPSASVAALAQTTDGYLWVGTREGLFRFDGVRFARWDSFSHEPLPDAWVRSLLATRDGALWIGLTNEGQIARVENGRITAFKGDNGLGRGPVLSLAQDPSGTVWASGQDGLFAFDGQRWSRWGAELGIPDGLVLNTFSDRSGNVYAAMGAGVFVRRRQADRFERATGFSDVLGNLAETADGTMWVTDPTVGYRRLAESPGAASLPLQGRGLRLTVDRKGSLWIGTGGQGLWRLRAPGAPGATLERSVSVTGLLGDGVYSLLEDRNGNIWAGTTEGLNRLTPRTIEQVIDIGLVRGLQVQPDGRVWIGTVNRLLTHENGAAAPPIEIPLPSEARSMTVDGHGMWVAAGNGVYRVDREGRLTRAALPAPAHLDAVDALSADGQGGVWLVANQELVHWSGNDVRRVARPDAVREARVTALFVSSTHEAWFAFSNGHVVVVSRDHTMRVLPGVGTRRPVYRTITEDSARRIWLGGEGALTLFADGRRATLLASEKFRVDPITALVTDDSDSLWIGAAQGVIHLEREEFERAVADERVAPRYTVHTRSDGVAGTPLAVGFNRGAVRTADGRLWFVTTRGVTIFDPHVLGERSATAPVRFEGATADDRRIAPGSDMTLPAGTRRLAIDYTVVNLTAPLKTRFRHRLDPFDSDWVDAGGRRQAFYTNLKPGQYVFHVVATDGSGDASPNEAAWHFTVAPRFYQTTTFAVVSAASIGLLLLGGWQLRERQLRKQFSLIISERARLGREIHDTLLQGLVAIALQFDSLAHDLAPMPKLQGRFLRLRDRIEEYIREARRSIWDLHTQPQHCNLVDSLRRAGEFVTEGCEIAFTLQVQGTPYQCPPQIEEQAVRIAQEAALNAVRHAAPQRLRIDLMYEDAGLKLTIADDGRGFKSDDSGSPGHYGILSMYERAKSVGGALTLISAPGRGTEVTAILPLAT